MFEVTAKILKEETATLTVVPVRLTLNRTAEGFSGVLEMAPEDDLARTIPEASTILPEGLCKELMYGSATLDSIAAAVKDQQFFADATRKASAEEVSK